MSNEELERQFFDIVLSTNKESNLDINYKFIYNTYSIDETIVDDKKIFDSGRQKKNRYIHLHSSKTTMPFGSIAGLAEYNSNFFDFEYDTDNSYFDLVESGDSVTNIKGILRNLGRNDHSLTDDELFYFNSICDYDSTKAFYYNETKSDDENLMNFYRLEENNITNFSLIQNSSKSFLSREIVENYKKNEENHFLPSQSEISILEKYDFLIKNKDLKKNTTSEVFNGNILGDFRIFETFANIDDLRRNASDITKIGFLLTKFKKIEEEKYEKISSKFIFVENFQNYNFSLKDENIIYGKTYLYNIQEVYLYRYTDNVSLDYILFCGYPFFTEDIECKETINPRPPVGLTAKYDHVRKKLKLRWSAPTNDQNDARGYQILKRNSLDEPFTVIAQLESHLGLEVFERKENINSQVIIKTPGINQNTFIDKSFDEKNVQIYAIRTLDAHGNLSLYSSQIGVLYNSIENNLIVDLVSKSEAPIDTPNCLIHRRTTLFENENFSITNLPIKSDIEKITLFVTPELVGI